MLAEAALKRLRLDQVWLLVSPGNPLKPRAGMKPLARRLASAQAMTPHRQIIATAIEARLHTIYTADTLRRLQAAFPRARFVWILGADNLRQLPRWHDWRGIMRRIPVVVFPRPGVAGIVLAAQAAQRFRHARLPARSAPVLVQTPPPAWIFLPMGEDPVSSTAIRDRYVW